MVAWGSGCCGAVADAAYANTPLASTYLVRNSPRTMAGYILYSNQALFPMWAHLEDALKEGSPRWEQTFGPAADLFSHFFRTTEALTDFLMGMHGFGQITSRAVVGAFDLSGFRTLVDLGGATGHLALAALERYPTMRAVLFDLQQVVDFSRRFEGERLDRVAGDFFRDPLPEADLYAIGRILHDWREDKILRLLGRIAGALPEGGGLVIAEAVLDEDRAGAGAGADAIAQHAGLHGRPGADALGIPAAAGGLRLRPRGGPPDRTAAGCDSGH